MRQKTKIKYNQDRLYYIICYTVIAILTLVVLYPIIYIISASLSNADSVVQGRVWLWPVDINLDAYKVLFNRKSIWVGYKNTIIYTVGGTVINLVITLMCAYPLARKNLRGRSAIMFLFSFTMLFNGGMIPNYVLVRELGLMNTRWSLMLPGAMSVYNMIVCRTFIQTNIPDELLEAAQIDGCRDSQFFFRVVLPLSKPIIAVLALWYGVSHWNAYFNAFLYLKNQDLYPLQIFLKELLVQSEQMGETEMVLGNSGSISQNLYVTLKYCVIIISTLPLFCVYPFVQKHFQKGVMVGSVKG
ncbi:MAG: carbohydrate ABC transporter permease [Lachnospiraceae bacterium]|nr:carbohydrate ABC transporter permease [Lachnospiraceae bacterium]